MRLQQLTETYDNLFVKDAEKRKEIAPKVFTMLQAAYDSIGGLKGNGFSSPEDMIANIPMWKIFRRGNDIQAVVMYKDKHGRKVVAMATDGSQEGKKVLAQIIKDDYDHSRSYIEISGSVIGFYRKVLGDHFDSITIPAEQAVQILKLQPDEYRIINEYEYARELSGEWITKRMVGSAGVKFNPK